MAIELCSDPSSARAWCEASRASGARLGFVPTMGALHEGHLALVRRAAAENDAACVSIFVNPLQFDDPRDFERYPRTLDADAELLSKEGCAMAFTGTPAQFFPEAPQVDQVELRDPGPSAAGLEGAFRMGHFAGVVTIVARLFELVRPHVAYFGEKDFQQSLVVRDLARALGYPEIVVCTTSREPDGLARSSRNGLLDPEARARATVLSRALLRARQAWCAGERDAAGLCAAMLAELGPAGVEVEYAEVRDPERWTPIVPQGTLGRARGLVAARVGGVRLIDTMALDEPERGGA